MQLPQDFISLIKSYGVAALDALPQALSTEPDVAVRLNRVKSAGVPIGPHAVAVPWCPEGYYLPERPTFTFDPAMHQGLYYVQDASSMFISHVIRHITDGLTPLRYLDACAAPGGKTTAAIDALPAGSLVVANEYVAVRATVLRENLIKWGYPATVTNLDTSAFAKSGEVFDIIAADVPCSGEGMMRKDSEAVAQWSPQLIERCVERQRYIVDHLWHVLAPGGYLIYSTCTFNRDENELMVKHLMEVYGAESVDIPVDSSWNILPAIDSEAHCYRFIPGLVRGEGLFMAVLRKPDEGDSPSRRRVKPPQLQRPAVAGIDRWLNGDIRLTTTPSGVVKALPQLSFDSPFAPTIDIATIKGRDAIPTQALAMSRLLNREAFSTFEVDPETALAYLHRQSLNLPSEAQRGILLLTFGGSPLGFVKNLGNRANNLYPDPWRILSPNGHYCSVLQLLGD